MIFIIIMPQSKQLEKDRYRKFIREYRNNVFKVDGHVFFCIPCNKGIRAEKKSRVKNIIVIIFVIFIIKFLKM